MKNTVYIRNTEIGKGITKICVPIVEKDKASILKSVKTLRGQKVDLIEWRADYYEDLEDFDKVKSVLADIRKIAGDIPIIFTVRNFNETETSRFDNEFYKLLNIEAIKTRDIDLIDIELFTEISTLKDLINIAKGYDIKVIISDHNFNSTPIKKDILNMYLKIQDLGADICKIVTMPQKFEDVLQFISSVNEINLKFAKIPFIAISMGKLGAITRICTEPIGSDITFGYFEKSCAKGQIEINTLRNILNELHFEKLGED